jgi:protein-S-isoprenylcysteine O-methyltransferase Ste14
MSSADIQLAEKLTLRRSKVAIVLGVFFLFSMTSSLGVDFPTNRPQAFKIAAWIVWAAALLFLLGTGGGLFRSRTVRALMNDDSTIENRRTSIITGYWAMVLTAFALYGVSIYVTVSSSDAIRLLLSAAVGVSVIKFGLLERQSLRNG